MQSGYSHIETAFNCLTTNALGVINVSWFIFNSAIDHDLTRGPLLCKQ